MAGIAWSHGAGGSGFPNACFTASPTSGPSPLKVDVDASCTTDDGTPTSNIQVRWDWDTGGACCSWDTNFTTTKTANHTYSTSGYWKITVQAKDSGGHLKTKDLTILVNNPPTACFDRFTTNAADGGFDVSVDASCSSDDLTSSSALEVRWDWENDGTWDEPAGGGYTTTKTATHHYGSAGNRTIKVDVKDANGSTSTASKIAGRSDPPSACFSRTLQADTTDSFDVDAGCSTDDLTATSDLEVRWDWQNDGTWDTAYSTTKTASTHYTTPGSKTLKLEVRDAGGVYGATTETFTVTPLATDERYIASGGEPVVDVDPGNTQHLAFVTNGGSYMCGSTVPYRLWSSTNAGSSWTQATGPCPALSADHFLSMDADGAMYTTSLNGTANKVDLVKFAANGSFVLKTKAAGIDHTYRFPNGTDILPCQNSDVDYEKVNADKSTASPYKNNAYVLVRVRFETDGDGTCTTSDAHITSFRRSTNGGSTWTDAQALIRKHFIEGVTVTANGHLYIFATGPRWPNGTDVCPTANTGLGFWKSTDGGASFQASACLFDGNVTGTTWAAAHPTDSNIIYAAFTKFVYSPMAWHVFVTKSADAGATWSTPVQVDNETNHNKYKPTISVSSNGRVDVMWFDWRQQAVTQCSCLDYGPVDVYYGYSTDGGVTWPKNIRLTPTDGEGAYRVPNDYLTIASSGTKAYAAYGHDRVMDSVFSPNGYLNIITFE